MSIPQRRLPLSRERAPKAQPASQADAITPEARSEAEAFAETLIGRNPLETLVLKRLDDEKAQDIIFIDLKDKSSVADALVVASGRSHRHVGAIADHLLRALKDAGHGKAKVEGLPACDWVLIDAGDLVIHLFRPEVRSFYNIEKIWSVEPPVRAAAH
jgi:ribosome-associated protein